MRSSAIFVDDGKAVDVLLCSACISAADDMPVVWWCEDVLIRTVAVGDVATI